MITRLIIIIKIKNLIILNIKNLLKTSIREERKEEMGNKYWHGKMLRLRWDNKELNEQSCFARLTS